VLLNTGEQTFANRELTTADLVESAPGVFNWFFQTVDVADTTGPGLEHPMKPFLNPAVAEGELSTRLTCGSSSLAFPQFPGHTKSRSRFWWPSQLGFFSRFDVSERREKKLEFKPCAGPCCACSRPKTPTGKPINAAPQRHQRMLSPTQSDN
jgi:hypothetical protein